MWINKDFHLQGNKHFVGGFDLRLLKSASMHAVNYITQWCYGLVTCDLWLYQQVLAGWIWSLTFAINHLRCAASLIWCNVYECHYLGNNLSSILWQLLIWTVQTWLLFVVVSSVAYSMSLFLGAVVFQHASYLTVDRWECMWTFFSIMSMSQWSIQNAYYLYV